jgi:hypothetical protein
MTIRRIVFDIFSILGNLASILYLLDYLGFKVSSLVLPTNTLYLILAILGVAVFTAYLVYEGVRAFRAHNQILTGEIFGEKENKFLVGGTICFRARYRGNLQNGYFTAKIRPEELHRILDTGREYEWLVDYNTYASNPPWGTLSGRGSGWLRKSHSSLWGHKIPFRYSFGEYTATLMVFDARNPSEPIEKISLAFTILDEGLVPLRGWTSEGQLIPAPRSMFVKKPRRRSWLGTLQ